jgi:hypothetical protein
VRSVLRAAGSHWGTARRVAVGAVITTLLVGGCGLGSGQFGAAAFVGGTEIRQDQVHSQLVTVLDRESPQTRVELKGAHQLDDVSRKIVTARIRHQLVVIAAQRERLTADQDRVNRLVNEVGGAEAASKGTIYDANGYRQRAADTLLLSALGRDTLRGSAVTIDYTTADNRAAAQQRVAELAKAGSKGARQMIDADVQAGKDAEVGKRIVAADDPIFATTPAFGVAEGSVVAFQLEDTKPWVVMVVKNRTNRGVQPSDHAPPIDQIDPAILEAVGVRQLVSIAQQVGVRLNPRYGVWDLVTLQAVPDGTQAGGFIASLRAAPRT